MKGNIKQYTIPAGISRFGLILILLLSTVFGGSVAVGANVYTVKIEDNIKTNGNLEAKVFLNSSPASLPEGTYIEWFCKIKTESVWKRIIPTKYSSGATSITENTLGCNVYLTGGARSSAGIVQYKAVITEKEDGTAIAASDPYNQDMYWGELQNSGFENWPIDLDTLHIVPNKLKIVGIKFGQKIYKPLSDITKITSYEVYYNQVENDYIPDIIWKSAIQAQGDKKGYDIELTRTETAGQKLSAWSAYQINEITYRGTPIILEEGQIPNMVIEGVEWLKKNPTIYPNQQPAFAAPEGYQFAEINCEQDGALYQDILTEPGAVLNWGVYHCARGSHTAKKGDKDEMYIICMATKDAEKLIDTYKDEMDLLRAELVKIAEGTSTYKGVVWTVSDAVGDGWKFRSSDDPEYQQYVVPKDQYLTRFFFVAKQSACGTMAGGNLVDGMYCGNKAIQPVSDRATLVIKKKFGGEITADDIAALEKSLLIDCNIGDDTKVIGSPSYPFSWSASDIGTYQTTFEMETGKAIDITIKERKETATVELFDLTTNYSCTGGSDYKMTDAGYTVKVIGGDLVTITIKNDYTKSKRNLIIKKNGLNTGENAVFTVKKAGDNNVLYRVLLTGNGEGTSTATIANLELGKYTVEETGWSWAYKASGSTELTQDITYGDGNVFTFTNEEKENTPLRDEAIKNNAIINAREGVTVNKWETEKRKIQF